MEIALDRACSRRRAERRPRKRATTAATGRGPASAETRERRNGRRASRGRAAPDRRRAPLRSARRRGGVRMIRPARLTSLLIAVSRSRGTIRCAAPASVVEAASASTRSSTPRSRSTSPFRDEHGATVALGQYFGSGKPVVLVAGLLPLPGALHDDAQRHDAGVQAAEVRAPARSSTSSRSASTRRRRRRSPPRRRRSTSQRVRPRRRRDRLALPDRRRAGDPAARASRRLPLRVRPQDQPVRPRQRHHGAHARGQRLPLLLRPGILRRATCGWGWSRRRRNKIGTLADAVMLLCYQYDPTSGKYGVAIMRTVRTGGVLTAGCASAASCC